MLFGKSQSNKNVRCDTMNGKKPKKQIKVKRERKKQRWRETDRERKKKGKKSEKQKITKRTENSHEG
jgi:hypothetical protein